MSLKGIAILFLHIFNSLIGIEHGPEDFESSSPFIISINSVGEVGEMRKELRFLSLRYLWWPLGVFGWGMFLSNWGPTFVKKLLNLRELVR